MYTCLYIRVKIRVTFGKWANWGLNIVGAA